jgi:hypothetical protein
MDKDTGMAQGWHAAGGNPQALPAGVRSTGPGSESGRAEPSGVHAPWSMNYPGVSGGALTGC